MKYFIFNEAKAAYEQTGYIEGKNPQEIAAEHRDITYARARQYAAERKLPYFGTLAKPHYYIFDAAAEQDFIDRPRKSTGRPATEKQPKIPGKPGRPRKEKPVDNTPKRPVGRPRKNPAEALDVVPKAKKKRGKK